MVDQTRRYTDHILKASDHDILIEVHTKINDLCDSHKDTRKELKEFADRIDTRCETRLDLINRNHGHIIGKTMFKWLFGFLILAMLTLYSAAGFNSVSVAKNESQIAQNGIQIGLNAEALKNLIAREP